jgi:serpin B
MHRALIAAAGLTALLALSPALMSCGGDSAAAAEVLESDAPRAEAQVADGAAAAAALEAFTADLYAVLAREDGNLVFSPYSAMIALAMTRAGAAGETLAQMDAVLHAAEAGDLDAGFNALDQAIESRAGQYQLGEETVDLELSTANQLWGQVGFPFHEAFLNVLAAQYGAGMRLLDFESDPEDSRVAINDWVSEQTRERIPDLIPEGVINEMTRLVLTNAIYLNAPWQTRFAEDATEPGPFTKLDGTTAEAQLMSLSEHLRYTRGDGYEAVELPYVDGSLSMLVVVPDEGEFADFEAAFDAAALRDVVAGLESIKVNLEFPRFEFRTKAALAEALKELGMPIAFDDGAADFSGMSPEGADLFLADVIHEAFISVDENGTEAAAATAVFAEVSSAPPPEEEVDLTVDRPFLFLVRDTETGTVLFMGRVVDPTAE